MLLAALVLPLAALAGPAQTTLNEVADPTERELLVRIVRVGLTRDRSSKPEHSAMLVCVRDRYEGSRRVRLRCATNHDWQVAANTSISRAMVGANQPNYHWNASTGHLNQWVNPEVGDSAGFKSGVIDISPNLLTDPAGKDESVDANLARIQELHAMLAVAKLPDASATPPQDVVRFARAFGEVRRSGDDETAAAIAVQASGLGLAAYNAFVTRMEQDAEFRARVAAALASLNSPLTI